MNRRALPFLLGSGLLLGLLCLAAGQLALGMGHGWELPRTYGALSLGLYPLALARWRWIGRKLAWSADLTLVAATIIPVLLLMALAGLVPSPVRLNTSGWTILGGGAALYAAIGALAARTGHQALVGDIGLLGLGLILDAVALASTADAASPALPLAVPWLVLWLGWQAAVVLALPRHARGG